MFFRVHVYMYTSVVLACTRHVLLLIKVGLVWDLHGRMRAEGAKAASEHGSNSLEYSL